MKYTLALNQVIVNGTDQFSPAQVMGNTNTVRGGITVISNSATSLTVVVQGSNDLQGWTDSTSDTGFTLGFAATAARAVAFAFFRMKFTVSGTGTIIFNADANTSQQ